MEKVKISAIEKMKDVLDWAEQQKVEFNVKFKTIADIETAYDFCMLCGWAFLDNISEDKDGAEDIKRLESLLGYRLS